MRTTSVEAYANRQAPSNSSSGFRGVSLITTPGKYNGKYRARLTDGGVRKILGYKDTPEEAAQLIKDWMDAQ